MRARLCCLTCLLALGSAAAAGEYLTWKELPQLPPAPGHAKQVGVAGPFAGVHNGALIVAGGANFPEAAPWEGGEKVWWDDVFVLEKDGAPAEEWITQESLKLPRPLAYGAAVSAEGGVMCIGGCDAERCYPDVFLLRWDPDGKTIEAKPLPPLPRPLAFMAAAKIGRRVYVVGGQEAMKGARATRHLLVLELSEDEDGAAGPWEELPPCPGPPRILPVVAAQSDGVTDCLYVFSGRNVAPGQPTEMLTDAWKFHPASKQWTRAADIALPGGDPRCVMAATGIASGANHILVFGGADGRLFRELERLGQAIEEAEDDATADELKAKQRDILTNHPGFSRDILAYHTVTDTWSPAGETPGASQVTTLAVRWDDAIVIPSGEIRPGVRTPKVWQAEPLPAGGLGTPGYVVLGGYLVVLVAMGVYFARREKTTDDFFKAGRRIPWWAAGISIYGTQLSAITFMAIPAKTFATDWRLYLANLAILMVAPFIIFLFLPFFRRLDVTTAYEYLEKRFNVGARLLASALFMLFQFSRIGIVLFLPSLALS
ncbi:MAG: sodium:solute symporter family transporter, partial [Planctomycetota bacterium]